MKKTYSTPKLVIVNVELQQMIAGSNPEDGFRKSNAKSLDSEIVNGNMSRFGGVWDEDFEDEEDF